MPAQTQEMPPRSLELPGADHGGIRSMAPQGYKQCSQCGETKPLDEFNRHRRMSDGYVNQCKTCTRANNRAWRKANSEHTRAYREANRERFRVAWRNWTRANPERIAEATKRRRAENPDAIRVVQARWRESNPEKSRAHQAVYEAVKSGRLARPAECEGCGTREDAPLHGHHEDYSRPLDVIWLCRQCHEHRHCELRDALVAGVEREKEAS